MGGPGRGQVICPEVVSPFLASLVGRARLASPQIPEQIRSGGGRMGEQRERENSCVCLYDRETE